MNAHARLRQLEEKHGIALPFLMAWDILDLLHRERMRVIDQLERRLEENRAGAKGESNARLLANIY